MNRRVRPWQKGMLYALFAYFTFIGGTFYSEFNLGLKVLNWILVTLVLAVWLIGRLRQKGGLPATLLDGAIALYLAARLISAPLGLSPRYSFDRLWTVFAYVLAFYLFVSLVREGWGRTLIEAVYLSAAAVCLIGLAGVASWYFGLSWLGFQQDWPSVGGWQQLVPPNIYRIDFLLGGPTPLAAYLALLIPPALGLVATLPARTQQRKALIVWLALAFVVGGFTFTRSGLLALAVSLPLTAIAWYANTPRSSPFWSAWPIRQRLLAGGLMLASGLVAGTVVLRTVTRSTGSITFRFSLWQSAMQIFGEQPLTGVGPFNFGRALLRMNDPNLPRAQITTAHNAYLNTAAETGLVGLVTGSLLVVMLVWAWWCRWRAATARERVQLGAVGAALVGLAVQTTVDTYLAPPNILPLLLMAAYIVAPLSVQPRPVLRRVWGWSMLAGLLVFTLALGRWNVAQAHYELGRAREIQGDLVGAILATEKARNLDGANTFYTFRLAYLLGKKAYFEEDTNLAREAIVLYEEGLVAEPVNGLHQANLAGLAWQVGESDRAIDAMKLAAETGESALYWLNLGYFLEQTRDEASAIVAYSQALAADPELADAQFWKASPGRAALWPEIVDTLLARSDVAEDPQTLFALAQDGVTEAEALLPPQTLPMAAVYLNTGRQAQAGALLAAMSGDQTRNATYALLQGRLLLTQEPSEAERLLRFALFRGMGSANLYLGRLLEARGDLDQAKVYYRRGFSTHFIDQNIGVTLYSLRSNDDLLPQLLRTGISRDDAAAWLALAAIYEAEGNPAAAQEIYAILRIEDPFFEIQTEN